MRHLIVIVTALALAAGALAAADRAGDPQAAATLSPPVYVLTGGGYGHGVGLSQYGALAQAQAGRSYREILEFYYPGTTLGTGPPSKVRVARCERPLGPQDRIGRTFHGARRNRDEDGAPRRRASRSARDLEVPVDGVPAALPGPLAFVPGKGAPITLDGKGYRGELRVSIVDGKLQAIDFVGLDAYLLGVVPGEMPKEWPVGGVEGAGGRGALVCARGPRQEPRLRSLCRPAQPGLLRRRLRVAGDDRSSEGDAR